MAQDLLDRETIGACRHYEIQMPPGAHAVKTRSVMNQQPSFDTLAEALIPHKTQAMILLEEQAEDQGWILLENLRLLVGRRATFKKMNDTPPLIFLVCLPAERLYEAVIRLTEQGVTRLKAVGPVAQAAPDGKRI